MIRTTVVGSWPIPRGLKPQLTAYYRGAVSDDDAREVLQAAARVVFLRMRSLQPEQAQELMTNLVAAAHSV